MVRISKQAERRAKSPRRRRSPSVKTGSKRDLFSNGCLFKPHANGIKESSLALKAFIPKKVG